MPEYEYEFHGEKRTRICANLVQLAEYIESLELIRSAQEASEQAEAAASERLTPYKVRVRRNET